MTRSRERTLRVDRGSPPSTAGALAPPRGVFHHVSTCCLSRLSPPHFRWLWPPRRASARRRAPREALFVSSSKSGKTRRRRRVLDPETLLLALIDPPLSWRRVAPGISLERSGAVPLQFENVAARERPEAPGSLSSRRRLEAAKTNGVCRVDGGRCRARSRACSRKKDSRVRVRASSRRCCRSRGTSSESRREKTPARCRASKFYSQSFELQNGVAMLDGIDSGSTRARIGNARHPPATCRVATCEWRAPGVTGGDQSGRSTASITWMTPFSA